MTQSGTKTIIITGANRGIGLGVSKIFLENKWAVHATSRATSDTRSLRSLEKEFPETLQISDLDVTDDQSVQKFTSNIKDFDILLNNAGLFTGKLESREVTADLLKSFDVNVLGAYRLNFALAPKAGAKGGVLAQMSSLMGSITDNKSGGHFGYRISKTALNMLTKNMSFEFPHLVSISLHPGWVQTDMGGKEAPLTVEESARGLFQVLLSADHSKTGQFLDYSGRKLPW